MIPNKSNTTNGCDSTSSNCVVWQGPDLSCVKVCNGDTISDILAKMCESIVSITSTSTGVDISTINQLCLEETYGVANNVQALIQNIITELCKVHNHPENDPCSCIIPLPDCLQYTDEMGNTVTHLPLYDGKTGDSYAVLLANKICQNINAINQLQNTTTNHEGRIVSLEQRPTAEPYRAPKVVTRYVGNVGRAQDMESVIVSLDEELGELSSALGKSSAINTALNVAPNFSDRDRLSGKGTMSAISQWNVNPFNMAQSFQNLWITMNDTRNAVQSIKETVASPLCKDVTLGVTGSVQKTDTGGFNAIKIDFTSTTVPSGYTACDSRGTKLTITDASLNTVVLYADVVNQYQNQSTYDVTTNLMGNLDTGSNYSVRVDFCVSNGDNQCSEVFNFTIDNELSCPDLDIGTLTSDSAPFSITRVDIPSNKGHVVSVNLLSSGGSLIDSRSYTSFSSGIAGTFTNLQAATQYQMRVEITRSGSTKPVQCAVSTFSTVAASCATEVIASSTTTRWFSGSTATTNLQSGANTIEIAAYNDGAGSKTKWTAGFDTTNQPIVVADTSATGFEGFTHQGTFINSELPTQSLTIVDFPLSPLSPSAAITRASGDSGWAYIGSLVTPNSSTIYVYAEVDYPNKTINQVVFSCNCSGLYLDTPKPVYTCQIGGSVTTTIDAVGFSPSSGDFSWTITRQPTHGTLTSVGGFPTSTRQKYLYTQSGTTMAADSFTVSMTNDCGSTVATKVVSILPARSIRYTTSDIVVFFDTTIMTEAAATDIKNSINQIVNGFTGDKPSVYYIPVQGVSAGDYLKHPKGLVERINENVYWTGSQASIDLATGGTWPTVAVYPSWWTGTTNFFPPDIKIISFVNKMSSSSGLYATATTIPAVASWTGFGPTSSSWANPHQYEEDYACVSDMIDVPTTAQRTIWTVALQANAAIPWTTGTIPFTFDQVIVPIIGDSAGLTATAALQQYAALQGSTLMTPQEVAGTKFGLEQFAYDGLTGINIAPYLDKTVTGTSIPYSGSVSVPSSGSITIQGLKDLTGGAVAIHSYIEQAVDLDYSTNPTIETIFRGFFNMESTGTLNQPTLAGYGHIGGKGTEFGVGSTSGDACSNAGLSSGKIRLYTAAGIDSPGGAGDPFTSIANSRAYTAPADAALDRKGVNELTPGQWYAISPGTGSVSYRAQYAGTAPYWTNIATC